MGCEWLETRTTGGIDALSEGFLARTKIKYAAHYLREIACGVGQTDGPVESYACLRLIVKVGMRSEAAGSNDGVD